MGIGELCNILKYVIHGFLIKSTSFIIADFFIYIVWFSFPSLDPYALTERTIGPYGSRA